MKTIVLLGLLFTFFVSTSTALAQKTNTASAGSQSAGNAAWEELEKSFRPPVPPAEWREKRPTEAEIKKFREEQRDLAAAAADKAKTFYTTYPQHSKASEAKTRERELLGFAVQLGGTNHVARLEKLDQEHLKNPDLSEEERFEIRMMAVQRAASQKQSEGMPAALAELEKGARQLQKEFPKRDEHYQLLLMVASNSDSAKTKALAEELVKSDAPEQVKTAAKGLLTKMEALGKPLDIKFTALDGRQIDLANMKGKVVLVDFWATWCGPCIAELPNVKAAYDKLHPKGFEIVGISFDQDKEELENFVKEEKMAWPQYFDGEGWQNKIGQQFGINSIPAMWLVDKKGILRDLNARADLEQKVEKYLAEQ